MWTSLTILDDVISFREVLEGRNIHRGGEGGSKFN